MHVTSYKSIPHELRTTSFKDEVYVINHYLDELNATDRRIITMKVTTHLMDIKDEKYTAVQVFKAYSKRAAVAHQLTNSISEYFPEEGLKMAEALDEHYFKTGKVVGFLHGLPVSIKDHIELADHLASTEFETWDERRSSKDENRIVKFLRKKGAIFRMETQMPMSGVDLETNSNLWGHVENPYKVNQTLGGSSGGEAVVVAIGGA